MEKRNKIRTVFCPFLPHFRLITGRAGHYHPGGFTVLEILSALLIIGLVCLFAAPSMTNLLRAYRLKSAANELASVLQLARVTAIAQNANSVFTFDTLYQSYSVFSDNGDGGGTINDGTQSGTEPTIKTISVQNTYYGQITLNAPSFGNSVIFSSQGTSNQSGTITLQDTTGNRYQIVLTVGGAIKVVRL